MDEKLLPCPFCGDPELAGNLVNANDISSGKRRFFIGVLKLLCPGTARKNQGRSRI